MRRFLEKYDKKLTIAGVVLLVVGIIGLVIGNTLFDTEESITERDYLLFGQPVSYKYDYLCLPAATILVVGFFATSPAMLRLTATIIRWLWNLVVRAIYEVCFAATSGIKDGKKKKSRS